MVLTALLLAASLAAPAVAVDPVKPQAEARPPATERMPNLYRQPARCGALHDEVTRRIATAARGRMVAQYAVMRQVGGCGVPTPLGYHPDYLKPGAADAPEYRPIVDKPQ